MRGFIAFTRKEFMEQLRTSKFLILMAVFFLFGMTSPLLAKLMPVIFSQMDLQGIKIVLPEPTVMDAYGQFFKNCTQMGMLVLLLVFGGVLTNELMSGTLINILAKGLGRPTVILSKYFAAVTLWTASYLMAAVVNYGYTCFLFERSMVSNLLISLFCLWLFGCFLLALIMLSSTLASGNFGGLIVTMITIAVMFLIDLIPDTARFNPITLASENVALLAGGVRAEEILITIFMTLLLTVISLLGAVASFQKKRL